jgi:hypothetical protein
LKRIREPSAQQNRRDEAINRNEFEKNNKQIKD